MTTHRIRQVCRAADASGIYASFTSDGSAGTLTGLKVSLDASPGGKAPPQAISVGLYADNGTAPGSLIADLEDFTDTLLPSGIFSVTLDSNPALDPNTRYWIGITADNLVGWDFVTGDSGAGVSGEFYEQNSVSANDGEPTTAPIMQVTESDSGTPEPASIILFGGGAAVAALLRRRFAVTV